MKIILLCTALIIITCTSTSAFSQRPSSDFGCSTNNGIVSISPRHAFSVHSKVRNTTTQSRSNRQTELNSSASEPEENGSTTIDFDAIAKEVFRKDKRPIILFDGVCNLCNGGVNFALDNDSIGKFRFASLQSKTGQALLVRSGKKASDISSIVLVTEGEAFFKSDAVLRIAKGLDSNPALPLIGTLGPAVPSFVRNTVYDFVAKNRYRFGEADQCRLDFDNDFGSRFVDDP